jgi:hypothetical protein
MDESLRLIVETEGERPDLSLMASCRVVREAHVGLQQQAARWWCSASEAGARSMDPKMAHPTIGPPRCSLTLFPEPGSQRNTANGRARSFAGLQLGAYNPHATRYAHRDFCYRRQ